MRHQRRSPCAATAPPAVMLLTIAVALAGCSASAHRPGAAGSTWALATGGACTCVETAGDRRLATGVADISQPYALTRVDTPQLLRLAPCRTARLTSQASSGTGAASSERTTTGPFPDDFGDAGSYAAARCTWPFAATPGVQR